MWRPNLSIRRKLVLSISIPLLVTYLGLLAWDYHRQRSLTIQQMQQTVLERAEGTAARLDARLTGAVHLADSLAALLESPANHNERQIQSGLSGAVRLPWVTSATITLEPADGSDAKTIIRHRGVGTPLPNRDRVVLDAALPTWYAHVQSTRAAGWTEPYEIPANDPKKSLRVCTYVVPIVAENVVAGAAAVTIDLRELRRIRGLRGGPPGPPPGAGAGAGGGAGGAFPGPPREFAAGPSDSSHPDSAHPSSPTGARPTLDSDGPRAMPPAVLEDIRREISRDVARDSARAAAEELDDFAVFDPQGRLVIAPSADEADPPTESLFETAARLQQPEMADAARRALKGESQVVRVTGLKQVIHSVPDDTHHWLAMTPVSAAGWLLVTAVPESANLAPVLDRLWARAAFLAGGLV
ncbi:MAG: hypothetical protein NTW19_07700, partial [Planctomycetota bacterium]|nr:hypothetical protein [Planctomycetota bacterium]